MPHQVAVTVRAPVLPGRLDDVTALLTQMHRQGATNDWVPFAQLRGLHFARLFLLDEVSDLDGRPIEPSLVYMGDVDGDRDEHLADLAVTAGKGVDALFGHCAGYPGDPSDAERAEWLAAHVVTSAAIYVHTVGRTVQRVLDETRLREEVERLLDGMVVAGLDLSPREVWARVRENVLHRPDLAWAASPAEGPDVAFRVREAVHLVVVPAVALALLPVILPVGLAVLVLIRLKEQSDVAESGPVDRRHADDVEQYEDLAAQNPFTAVGFVKAGLVRRATMKVALFGLDYANRHFFTRDNLAGVRSIHFARWVPIDDGRRVIFASSYDGSQESYMNDFIDRLAWGLNLVFSNGVGYPSTRWLLLGGAHDEPAFKHYLRRHQVPTVVWYSAYPTLHAPTADANSTLRDGVASPAGPARPAEWLALL